MFRYRLCCREHLTWWWNVCTLHGKKGASDSRTGLNDEEIFVNPKNILGHTSKHRFDAYLYHVKQWKWMVWFVLICFLRMYRSSKSASLPSSPFLPRQWQYMPIFYEWQYVIQQFHLEMPVSHGLGMIKSLILISPIAWTLGCLVSLLKCWESF